jgi:hypothetical protein
MLPEELHNRPGSEEETRRAMVAYDFLKHITSLALVSIGGILALLQASGQKPDRAALISLAMIGASAIFGTIVLNGFTVGVVTGHASGTGDRTLVRSLRLVAMPLLLGLGIFVGTYLADLG